MVRYPGMELSEIAIRPAKVAHKIALLAAPCLPAPGFNAAPLLNALITVPRVPFPGETKGETEKTPARRRRALSPLQGIKPPLAVRKDKEGSGALPEKATRERTAGLPLG